MTLAVSSAASGAAAAVMLTLGSLSPESVFLEVGAGFTVLFCVLIGQVCYRHDYRKAYGLPKRQPRHQN